MAPCPFAAAGSIRGWESATNAAAPFLLLQVSPPRGESGGKAWLRHAQRASRTCGSTEGGLVLCRDVLSRGDCALAALGALGVQPQGALARLTCTASVVHTLSPHSVPHHTWHCMQHRLQREQLVEELAWLLWLQLHRSLCLA